MNNKILIVDDESHMLELLRYNFKKEGYEVAVASDGAEGVESVKKEKPDLIISDVMMPRMDGIEFCKALREKEETNSIPFIFLTAKGQLPDKITGLKTGADDYITKPFIPRELIEMVNTRLKRISVYKEKAEIDELTNIYNRKYFKDKLASDLSKAERLGIPLALGFIDIDRFGEVNDRYGHPVGDIVLRDLAGVMKRLVSGENTLARYGGEEFVVIMPVSREDEDLKLMEEICRRVEDARFSYSGKEIELKVTVSIGVAFFPRDAKDADSIISAADRALYIAKNGGRNRVAALK